VDYRILGPLEVCQDGRVLALGGDRQRALLAMLLLHPNAPVSADELIDGLWGERPPRSASNALRVHVSRLRTAFEDGGEQPAVRSNGLVSTHGHGYALRVDPGELDVDRFRDLAELGRKALADNDPGEASRLLRSALALWRGPPLADFRYEPFAQPAIARLEELRLAALEQRIEADMALGRHTELVAELAELVEQNPLRERLRGQLMLALYRSGRQAEALGVYQEFRRTLSEQLGLDPGPALEQLELAILSRDPSLGLSAGPKPLDGSGSNLAAATRATVARRPLRLAFAGSVLVALAVAGVVIASGGGGKRPVGVADSVAAISPSTGVTSAVVPIGSSPSELAAGAGALWVSEYNADAVLRIDTATHALVQTIPVDSTPSGLAVGDGAVWVANSFSGTVSWINPAVNRVVKTIPVGNGPAGVAVGDGSVWVADSSDGALSRIDALTGKPQHTIPLGGGATDVTVGVGGVWVSDSTDGRVVRVDPQTDRVVGSVDVGAGGSGAITVGFGSVWVANSLDGTVTKIDPQTNQVKAVITVGTGPSAIAVGAGGVWVANEFSASLSRIDPARNTVTRTVALAGRPAGLALAGGAVWAGMQAAGGRHRGGTLTVMSNGGFGSLDPVSPHALIPSWLTLDVTNDGLTAFKRVGGPGGAQLVPDLAISLPAPTDGGTSYTFQLRRGIRYSNGQPLRPEDFRRAFERMFALEAGVNSPGDLGIEGGAACVAHGGRCDLARGIVTDDSADTVTFHLVAPDPEFLDKLTYVQAFAVPATTPIKDLGTHALPATGPYEVASYSAREVRLARNRYFHEWSPAAQPDGYPDQIVWRTASSVEAAVTAVEQGRADYTLDQPPGDRLSELRTRFASQLNVNPNDVTVNWTMNTRVAPFNNLSVRQALNYAVDRSKIATILGQDSRPTCQLLPPYIPGYVRYCPYTAGANAPGVWRGPDLAKAEALIAASGTRGARITVWDQGAPPWITDAAAAAISRYLVALLNRLGYRATLKSIALTDTSYQPQNSRLKIQDSLGVQFVGYPAASQLLGPGITSCQSFIPASANNPNVPELCDSRLDATVGHALAAEAAESPTATALWAQADRQLTDQAPAVELVTPSTTDLVSHRVGNYQYNPQQGVLIDQLWVR
jgi:YVTN family beta-propeller protein